MIGAGFNQFAEILGYKLNEHKHELETLETSLPNMSVELSTDAKNIQMFIDNSEHLFDLDMYSQIVKASVEDFGISGAKYNAFMDATNNASANIVEKIKEFFKHLWEKILEYFGKFIDWIKGKERVYNAVKEQLQKIDSTPLTDDQLRPVADVLVAKPELVAAYASALTKLSQDTFALHIMQDFAKYTEVGYILRINIDFGKLKQIQQMQAALMKGIESSKENGFAKFSEVQEYSSVNGVKQLFDKIDSTSQAIGDVLKVIESSRRAVFNILQKLHLLDLSSLPPERRSSLRFELMQVLQFVSTLQVLADGFFASGTNVGRVFIKAKQIKSEDHGSDVRDVTATSKQAEQNVQNNQQALPA